MNTNKRAELTHLRKKDPRTMSIEEINRYEVLAAEERDVERLSDATSRVVVDVENPHDEASVIIKNCRNAQIVQKKWR